METDKSQQLGCVLHFLRDSMAYKVSIPRHVQQDFSRDSEIFSFSIQNLDQNKRFVIPVRLTLEAMITLAGDLHLEALNQTNKVLLATRACYQQLADGPGEVILSSEEVRAIFAKDRGNPREIRKSIAQYAIERYEYLFDEPFQVFEFVCALPYDCSRIVRQLGYFHNHGCLVYSGYKPGILPASTDVQTFYNFDMTLVTDMKGSLDMIAREDWAKRQGTTNDVADNNNVVFVVHGRNVHSAEIVKSFLDKCGLSATILSEQPDKGKTLIEKFESHGNVSAAIVLLQPEDEGRLAGDKEWKYRARQNVILELGYFYGKLGRERVICLRESSDDFEVPSDIAGVMYTKFTMDSRWKVELARELNSMGFKIDLNRVL